MNPKKYKPTPIKKLLVLQMDNRFYILCSMIVLLTLLNLVSLWQIWSIKLFPVTPVALELNIDGITLANVGSPSKLVNQVAARFDIPVERSKEIINLAKAYEDKVFPTFNDILAIIAVESSFNPSAQNAGAYGLMQIQYGWHKDKTPGKNELFDPWQNIGVGAAILKQYYQITGTREAAVIAYQAGIGSYLEGNFTREYLDKFVRERSWFGKIKT